MNKRELIGVVFERLNESVSKRQIKSVVETLFDSIKDSVKEDKRVTIAGFGTFKLQKRKAKNGINPQTMEKIKIPSKNVPKFKASDKFLD